MTITAAGESRPPTAGPASAVVGCLLTGSRRLGEKTASPERPLRPFIASIPPFGLLPPPTQDPARLRIVCRARAGATGAGVRQGLWRAASQDVTTGFVSPLDHLVPKAGAVQVRQPRQEGAATFHKPLPRAGGVEVADQLAGLAWPSNNVRRPGQIASTAILWRLQLLSCPVRARLYAAGISGAPSRAGTSTTLQRTLIGDRVSRAA